MCKYIGKVLKIKRSMLSNIVVPSISYTVLIQDVSRL